MSDEIQEYGKKNRTGDNTHIKYKDDGKGVDKKKLVIGLVALLVTIVLIVVLINSCSGKKDSDDTKETTSKEEVLKTEETVKPDEKPSLVALSSDNKSDIYDLIDRYIEAAYVKCDENLLKDLMDSTENVDLKKNEVRQRYIESYNDLLVYVLEGKDGLNVVFISYKAKLNNYDELLPAGEMMVIKEHTEKGYLIHNIEVGEQFENLMVNPKQVEELSQLQEKIQSEYNAVIESNSEIKSIVDILNGAKNQ